jgi:hypothetical protein
VDNLPDLACISFSLTRRKADALMVALQGVEYSGLVKSLISQIEGRRDANSGRKPRDECCALPH